MRRSFFVPLCSIELLLEGTTGPNRVQRYKRAASHFVIRVNLYIINYHLLHTVTEKHKSLRSLHLRVFETKHPSQPVRFHEYSLAPHFPFPPFLIYTHPLRIFSPTSFHLLHYLILFPSSSSSFLFLLDLLLDLSLFPVPFYTPFSSSSPRSPTRYPPRSSSITCTILHSPSSPLLLLLPLLLQLRRLVGGGDATPPLRGEDDERDDFWLRGFLADSAGGSQVQVANVEAADSGGQGADDRSRQSHPTRRHQSHRKSRR